MTPQKIRETYLKRRASLCREALFNESAALLAVLENSQLFQDAAQVLSYMPLLHEAEISGVRALCHKKQKHVAYPVTEGDDLQFYEVFPETSFSPGSFKVPEPEKTTPVDWQEGIVLIPGAVFDRNGGRYGYGRGYYDRYCSQHPYLTRIGVCLSVQLYDGNLPLHAGDVRMQFLLTREGIISVYESK